MTIQDMLTSLNNAGLNDREIAEHCRVEPSTIWRLRLGETVHPSFPTGQAIIALCEQKQAEAAA